MKQSLLQKKAEVTFRDTLARQHTKDESHFSKEYTRNEIHLEFQKRLLSTKSDFKQLHRLKIPFKTYIELGAEYCFRSALLESEFNAHGFAVDISAHSLQQADYFANKLALKKIPQRICADAHALPFLTQTLPFIFSYQTIHHFPNPLPVIDEIIRILKPGGYFYMREEPIRQLFNLRIFRRPTKQTGINKILRTLYILPFISDIGKTETDHGIVEESFTLTLWTQIVTKFSRADIEILPLIGKPYRQNVSAKQPLKVPLVTKFQLALFGGGISFLARKKGNQNINIKSLICCPNCKKKLSLKKKTIQCPNCESIYQYRQHIWYFLSPMLYKYLYEKE